jgi:hypothetical protein
MKSIFTLVLACSLFVTSSSAQAWFFIYIPGSVISAIGDAIAGSEGEHCVGENIKVGDNIDLSSGGVGTIRSLSGTSNRCTNPERPIRAKVEPSSESPAQTTTRARIDLPDGWEVKPLTGEQKKHRVVLHAHNPTITSWINVSTVKRSLVTDMPTAVKGRTVVQANRMTDAQVSDISELNIGGLRAWRFEITGTYNKVGVYYNQTLIESAEEVVGVETWTTTTNYREVREPLLKIVDSLTGLPPPYDQVKEAGAKKKAVEAETMKSGAAEEARRPAPEEEARRIAAEGVGKQIKNGVPSNDVIRLPFEGTAAVQSHPVDFDVEASRAAKILGCQTTQVKVTGAEGGNIRYRVVCDGAKTLNLSCDPTGLCLQKK